MEQTFKIQVPDGCSAKIEQQGNCIVVVVEQKKWNPKDGDIISFGTCGTGIFKKYDSIGHEEYVTYVDDLFFNETGWLNDNVRPATDAEKQRLFDALAKEGKRWNAEEKRIEDLPRWRAEKGGRYYCLCADSTIYDLIEDGDQTDNTNYECGNYFKTREAAEKVAEQVRRIFKESKAE